MQRRPINATVMRAHSFRVNAAELARRKFLHLAAGGWEHRDRQSSARETGRLHD
jgi:hypothetical protein